MTVLTSLILCIGFVNASDDGFYKITSEQEFDECLKNETACRLNADINFTNSKKIEREVILDLNGHSILPNNDLKIKGGLITIGRNGKLIINDSKGNGKISTGSNEDVWAAIQLLDTETGTNYAELEINGGTIEGYYYGITGNGKRNNTRVIINNGTIKGLNKEDSAGIFQPQIGELIINNGQISGGTGIEIRSGNLTINNGNIEGLASKFVKMVNGSGTTTNGVGITISQHTTKNSIKVNINDGNISGQYALYEWNPHDNDKEDLAKIELHIYGGNFTGYASGVKTIYSQDFKNFISGGKFNKDVDEYKTEDAKQAVRVTDNKINTKKDNKNIFWIVIITIAIFISMGAGIVYYMKKKY